MDSDHPADDRISAPAYRQLLFKWGEPETKNRSDANEVSGSGVPAKLPASDVSPVTVGVVSDGVNDHDAAGAGFSFDPGHPWYYYHMGDKAQPIPFKEIPASTNAAESTEQALPKAGGRRKVKARIMLEEERRALDETRARYLEVIERGVEALSRYDIEIASQGNADMARSVALSLLYNQIAWRRGRIEYLEQVVNQQPTRHR